MGKVEPLEVIRLGNPKLREKAKPISMEELKSQEFQFFLDRLIETMRVNNGAGIAAPQVAVLKRFFVMEMDANPRYPEGDEFPLRIAINPELKLIGKPQKDSWEGCLSIPDMRGKLLRHERVILTAQDRNGKPYREELGGFEAIVAQHEMDHLNGILFLDRMESMNTLTFTKEYSEFWV